VSADELSGVLGGPRIVRLLWAALVLLVACYVLYTLTHVGGEQLREFVLKWVNDAVTVLAAALCFLRASRVRAERAAWFAIGLSILVWACGNLYYSLFLINLNPLPVPSVADALWLLIYPGLFVGIVLLLRDRRGGFGPAMWLDGAMAGLSLCALSAAVVLHVALGSASESTAATVTNIAYPVGDMFALGAIAVALALSRWRPGRMWASLALGLVAFTLADSFFLIKTANGTYSVGTVVDAGWLVGAALFAMAAWQPRSLPRVAADDQALSRLLVPACFGMLSLVLLIWDHVERINTTALVLSSVALVAVIVRMTLSFRENRRLVAALRGETVLLAGQNEQLHELQRVKEQLRQAQKMEAVGQLAGGIAHDFNNLLTVISGYSELATLKAAKDPQVLDCIERIQTAADSAADLTHRLLSFSSTQTSQTTLRNLNELVSAAEKTFGRVLGEQINLEIDLAADAGNVRVDPGLISQTILNLVLNARDAISGQGTIRITTSLARLDDGQRELLGLDKHSDEPWTQITVEDNGCGMDEQTLQQAVEPFFTTKPKGKGTGLGLSMVYASIRANGGLLVLDSRPGSGTEVKILLPQAPSQTATVTTEGESAAAAPTATTAATILLVEDEALVRELITATLNQHGYRIEGYSTPTDAVAAFQRNPDMYDVLLTDLVMPEMNGRELADQLRRQRPELPTVFISGYTEGLIKATEQFPPGTAFLAKPFTTAQLLDCIRHQQLTQPKAA
jgi:signal transduction histidine kinase/ActR/RegA family two-component response regulator